MYFQSHARYAKRGAVFNRRKMLELCRREGAKVVRDDETRVWSRLGSPRTEGSHRTGPTAVLQDKTGENI